MSQRTLAIDVDDVIVPHYQELADHLGQNFGCRPRPVDIIRWRTDDTLLRLTGASRQEIIDVVNKFITSLEFYQDPHDNVIQSLKRLRTKYRMVVITARPLLIQQLTTEWLEQHFPDIFADKVFVGGDDWGNGGKAADKTQALKDLGADILVDDHPRHCAAAAALGVRVIMFGDYDWNRDSEHDTMGLERAHDWIEVCDKLL